MKEAENQERDRRLLLLLEQQRQAERERAQMLQLRELEMELERERARVERYRARHDALAHELARAQRANEAGARQLLAEQERRMQVEKMRYVRMCMQTSSSAGLIWRSQKRLFAFSRSVSCDVLRPLPFETAM